MGVPPPAPSASTMITSPVSSPTFPVPMPTFPVPMPTFPAMTGAIDPNNCAGEGGRAQQCGASANRAPMCCEGFVCMPGNAKVSCCNRCHEKNRNRVKCIQLYLFSCPLTVRPLPVISSHEPLHRSPAQLPRMQLRLKRNRRKRRPALEMEDVPWSAVLPQVVLRCVAPVMNVLKVLE